MTEHQWRAVAEFIQQAGSEEADQALMEQLVAALHELNVPRTVVERLQQATSTALRRAFEADNSRAVSVIVMTQAVQPLSQPMAHSWGFFLLERGTSERGLYQITVFLYPDGS